MTKSSLQGHQVDDLESEDWNPGVSNSNQYSFHNTALLYICEREGSRGHLEQKGIYCTGLCGKHVEFWTAIFQGIYILRTWKGGMTLTREDLANRALMTVSDDFPPKSFAEVPECCGFLMSS